VSRLIVDDQYYDIATHLISHARKEILFCTFKLESCPAPRTKKISLLLSRLISVSSLIPETKVILNSPAPGVSIAKVNACAAHSMKKCGIDVRYLPDRRTAHAKLLIVDEAHLILGSHNWSLQSLTNNFEVSIYLQEPELISQARDAFLNAFQSATKF
jgi:phosphatidylserine/phosphatidylglycerophosphate/cardiolipin synthase-like enzyme